MTTDTREPERVTTGTIHDLPTPLARAYAMAMNVGLKIELLDPEDTDFLAALTLEVDNEGIRDVMLLSPTVGDNTMAEAIFFVIALVAVNRDGGLDLGPLCADLDGQPFIAITTERVVPDKPGFGRLAVEMSRRAGIDNPTAFVIADPPDASEANA